MSEKKLLPGSLEKYYLEISRRIDAIDKGGNNTRFRLEDLKRGLIEAVAGELEKYGLYLNDARALSDDGKTIFIFLIDYGDGVE